MKEDTTGSRRSHSKIIVGYNTSCCDEIYMSYVNLLYGEELFKLSLEAVHLAHLMLTLGANSTCLQLCG